MNAGALESMKIKEIIVTVLVFSSMTSLYAQNIIPITIPVFHDGRQIEYPFTGGLNSPQFNQIDVNLDGHDDLLVFERSSGTSMVFVSRDESYNYSNEFDHIFPALNSWVVIKDFNNDGIEDIFTAPAQQSNAAVAVWKGYIIEGELSFRKLNFPYGNGDVLSYPFFDSTFDIYVARPDIPGIIDIDHDGDLDILSFESGGGTVNYFRNRCIEEGLSLDSFKMELADRCWGKFSESLVDESIILSENPDECASGSGFRHSGSTINPVDLDADGDYDLLLGDSDYESLIKIENSDAAKAFAISVERDFPQYDTPVNLKWFLSSFLIDVNKDGKKDLIVAPNTDIGSKNYNNVCLYWDISFSAASYFKFIKKDFLVGDMIDWGSQVYPELLDINNDGLTDLLLGMSGLVDNSGNSSTKLILYYNTGSKYEPEFTLADNNFLSLESAKLGSLAPASGDMDNDGDIDLLVGTESGKLIFFDNISQGTIPDFAPPVFNYMGIDVGYNALPAVTDIDNDGDQDLIIGNANSYNLNGSTGSLALFTNDGDPGMPHFNPDFGAAENSVPWGALALHENNFNLRSMVRPCFFDAKDGEYMALGSIRGAVGLYKLLGTGYPELVTDTLDNIDFGQYSAPCFNDLDQDGNFEMIVGTGCGGFRLFKSDMQNPNTGLIEEKTGLRFKVYPNPARNFIIVKIIGRNAHEPFELKVHDLWGNEIFVENPVLENLQIDIHNWAAGIYQLTFNNGKHIHSIKLAVQK